MHKKTNALKQVFFSFQKQFFKINLQNDSQKPKNKNTIKQAKSTLLLKVGHICHMHPTC